MAQDSTQRRGSDARDDGGDDAAEPVVGEQQKPQTDDFDDLLDEIDGVLETNAAEFVRSFVQKGGQ